MVRPPRELKQSPLEARPVVAERRDLQEDHFQQDLGCCAACVEWQGVFLDDYPEFRGVRLSPALQMNKRVAVNSVPMFMSMCSAFTVQGTVVRV